MATTSPTHAESPTAVTHESPIIKFLNYFLTRIDDVGEDELGLTRRMRGTYMVVASLCGILVGTTLLPFFVGVPLVANILGGVAFTSLMLLAWLRRTGNVDAVRALFALMGIVAFLAGAGLTAGLNGLGGAWGIIVLMVIAQTSGYRMAAFGAMPLVVLVWVYAVLEESGRFIPTYISSDNPFDYAASTTAALVIFLTLSTMAQNAQNSARAKLAAQMKTIRAQQKMLEEANRKVQASALFFEELIETMPGALFVVDDAGVIKNSNTTSVELTGLDKGQLEGVLFSDIFPNVALEEQFDEGFADESQVQAIDATMVARDKSHVPLTLFARRLTANDDGGRGFVTVGLDMRGERALELKLRHAQKLEAVGRLAAGVAHEINTPTQFVKDSVEFIQGGMRGYETLLMVYQTLFDSLPKNAFDDEIRGVLEKAKDDADIEYMGEHIPRALGRATEGIDRIASIVKSMKIFAHPGEEEQLAVSLNDAVLSTLIVARSEYKMVAEAVTELRDIPPVMCHANEINQVLLNLIVNAAHSIEDKVRGTEARGTITIRSERVNTSVHITVSDTGGGIPEAAREHIFDPFFTTKEVGRGSGQGLAIARSVVVERHGGDISFETEMGKGTTFKIVLPLAGKRGAVPPRRAAA